MKSTELMIGNWLFNRNINKAMQVYPMMFSQMFRRTPEATTEDYGFYPIPLTAELLEKNGFKRGIDRGWGNDIREVYCLTFDVDVTYQGRTETFTHEIEAQHKVSSDLWDVETTNGSRIFNLEYLHQLQNALRLCGIKREIIAF